MLSPKLFPPSPPPPQPSKHRYTHLTNQVKAPADCFNNMKHTMQDTAYIQQVLAVFGKGSKVFDWAHALLNIHITPSCQVEQAVHWASVTCNRTSLSFAAAWTLKQSAMEKLASYVQLRACDLQSMHAVEFGYYKTCAGLFMGMQRCELECIQM